ncbi:MAG TPA: hypothetical protein PKK10_14790 [Woeseiaceae bacterium]|nr:hypothetical protein [Woeseiaceae bacterium]
MTGMSQPQHEVNIGETDALINHILDRYHNVHLENNELFPRFNT